MSPISFSRSCIAFNRSPKPLSRLLLVLREPSYFTKQLNSPSHQGFGSCTRRSSLPASLENAGLDGDAGNSLHHMICQAFGCHGSLHGLLCMESAGRNLSLCLPQSTAQLCQGEKYARATEAYKPLETNTYGPFKAGSQKVQQL